jgi:hypothetical protein
VHSVSPAAGPKTIHFQLRVDVAGALVYSQPASATTTLVNPTVGLKFEINDGATTTPSPVVELNSAMHFYGLPDGVTGSATHWRVSDSSFSKGDAGPVWRPDWQSTLQHLLPGSFGGKTVWFQTRGQVGTSQLATEVKSYQIKFVPTLGIASFELSGGPVSVGLIYSTNGNVEAAFYRVSESPFPADTPASTLAWRADLQGPPYPTHTLSDSSPGEKRLYFQVKSAGLDNYATSAVERAAIDVAARPDQRLVFTRGNNLLDVMTHAQSRGFTVREVKVSGTGNCYAVDDGTSFSARRTIIDVFTLECEFGFFESGKRLQNGWRLISVALDDADGFRMTKAPAGTDDPNVRFRLTNDVLPVNENLSIPYSVRTQEVVLEGPAGANWRDAF